MSLSPDGERVFTVTMLTMYREMALANYAEAEELLSRALDLRDSGHAMLARAAELAAEQAKRDDARAAELSEVDW